MPESADDVGSGSDASAGEGDGHYVAILRSLAAYMHVCELVGIGSSYLQVEGVVCLSSSKLGVKARKILSLVIGQTTSLYTRLSAIIGPTLLSKTMRASWCL